MTTVYESKRDAWIVGLIWAGALGALAGGVAQFTSPAPLGLRVALLIFLGSAAAFMLWILYGTDYTLSDEELRIRCGPFHYGVPLRAIDSVTPSRNPLSSPALSLDRLLIQWGPGPRRILISPSRRSEFLQELSYRREQLKP